MRKQETSRQREKRLTIRPDRLEGIRWFSHQALAFLFGIDVVLDATVLHSLGIHELPAHALLAPYPHTSHADLIALRLALGRKLFNTELIALKGKYWIGMKRALLHFFAAENRLLDVDEESTEALLQDAILALSEYNQTSHLIMFVQKTRNLTSPIEEGFGFLAAQLNESIYPIYIDLPTELQSKHLPILHLLHQGIRRSLTGKRKQATITFLQPIHAQEIHEQVQRELAEKAEESSLISQTLLLRLVRKRIMELLKNQYAQYHNTVQSL